MKKLHKAKIDEVDMLAMCDLSLKMYKMALIEMGHTELADDDFDTWYEDALRQWENYI